MLFPIKESMSDRAPFLLLSEGGLDVKHCSHLYMTRRYYNISFKHKERPDTQERFCWRGLAVTEMD